MFGWLKKLFSGAPAPVEVVEQAVVEQPIVEPEVQAEKPAKKKSKKGSGKCDFSKLTKTQLLAEAKHRGVKANASMKKQDILDRLNAASK